MHAGALHGYTSLESHESPERDIVWCTVRVAHSIWGQMHKKLYEPARSAEVREEVRIEHATTRSEHHMLPEAHRAACEWSSINSLIARLLVRREDEHRHKKCKGKVWGWFATGDKMVSYKRVELLSSFCLWTSRPGRARNRLHSVLRDLGTFLLWVLIMRLRLFEYSGPDVILVSCLHEWTGSPDGSRVPLPTPQALPHSPILTIPLSLFVHNAVLVVSYYPTFFVVIAT